MNKAPAHDFGVEAVYAESEHRYQDAARLYEEAAKRVSGLRRDEYRKQAARCRREEAPAVVGKPIRLEYIEELYRNATGG